MPLKVTHKLPAIEEALWLSLSIFAFEQKNIYQFTAWVGVKIPFTVVGESRKVCRGTLILFMPKRATYYPTNLHVMSSESFYPVIYSCEGVRLLVNQGLLAKVTTSPLTTSCFNLDLQQEYKYQKLPPYLVRHSL